MEINEEEKNDGYYILHKNMTLYFSKYKPDDIAKYIKIWKVKLLDRANAWDIAIEASLLGVKRKRIFELINKWGLNNTDAFYYARLSSLHLEFIEKERIFKSRFKNIAITTEGIGPTAFEAFVDLYEKSNLVKKPIKKIGLIERIKSWWG